MNSNEKFNNILNECLDRILKGETIEQCLRSYPEQAKELEPLLHTAQIAKKASSIQPRAEFKAQARYQFQSALREMEAKKKQPTSFFHWRWRWQWQSGWAIAVVVIIIVVLSGGGTVAAASNSMPDDTLYPVKLAAEQVQLSLTFSDVGKAELNAKLADKRVDEIITMASKGDTQNVIVASQNLNHNLKNITNLAGDGDKHQIDTTLGTSNGTNSAATSSSEQQPKMAASASTAAPVTAAPMLPTATSRPLAQSGNSLVGAGGTQIYPMAGATNIPTKPVFQWAAIQGAASYDLQVADNPIFVNPLDSQTGLNTTVWTETETLDNGKTYYWRVRAVSASGVASDWVAQSFTVAAAAPVPGAISGTITPVPTITAVVPNQPTPTFNLAVPTPVPGVAEAPDSSGKLGTPSVSSQESGSSQMQSAENQSVPGPSKRNNSSKSNDREKIRQIIIQNAVDNQAKLEEALNKAPARVKPAIRQAITQSQAEVDKALRNLDQAQMDDQGNQ